MRPANAPTTFGTQDTEPDPHQTETALVGRAPSDKFEPDLFIKVYHTDMDKLFDGRQQWLYRHADLQLMLAKIAHSYAVADVGLDELSKYHMPLPELIRTKACSIGHYVGGQPKTDPPAEPGLLHRLQVERGDINGIEFIIVHIRLFAFLGAPIFHVVAGERPITS